MQCHSAAIAITLLIETVPFFHFGCRTELEAHAREFPESMPSILWGGYYHHPSVRAPWPLFFDQWVDDKDAHVIIFSFPRRVDL